MQDFHYKLNYTLIICIYLHIFKKYNFNLVQNAVNKKAKDDKYDQAKLGETFNIQI